MFTASGNWALVARSRTGAGGEAQRRTSMDFALDIRDSGELLARFGMNGVLRRGKGRIAGQVGWLGSPLSPDYRSMTGQINLNVESGQFLKADPGLAKLLGVLSLQSLPRRLTLDFRDVFSEGFAFDFVRGDVHIEQGVATTNNLQMKGVNAAVLMEGSADIERETQDLHVVVVPEINAMTASLVATAINPVIGLGSFLAQVFLRGPLIQAATQEFRIDGTWADPRVERIQPQPRKAPKRRSRPASPRAPRLSPQPQEPRHESRSPANGVRRGPASQSGGGTPAAGAGRPRRRRAGRAARVLLRHGPARHRQAGAARDPGRWRGAVVSGTDRARAGPVDRGRHRAAGHARPAARCATLCWRMRQAGDCVARYDKIHLFRFDNGREQFDEGRVLEAGAEAVALQAGPLRVGMSVCYDLRFPELYRQHAQAGADLLLVPSAFTYTTGQAHWELLLRARAVENLAYVLAPAQGGQHENGRRTWGHSMLVDPWGQVLAQQAQGPGVVLGELDAGRAAQRRAASPALEHRVL